MKLPNYRLHKSKENATVLEREDRSLLSVENKKVKSCAQRNRVLLDSQSSVDLFCNPDLVSNIRPSKAKLNLVTYAEVLQVRQQADVANYGTVWFNEKAMTNVFSLASMEKRYRVTSGTI